MRRDAKIYKNWLGSSEAMARRYEELAAITDDEKNQIKLSLTSRPDRLEAVKALAAAGVPGPQIAELTGWNYRTVKRDLQKLRGTNVPKRGTNVPSKTGSAATKAHRAQVAEEAASEGVTDAPTEKYRIVYADPPWDYGAHAQPDYQTEQRDHYPVMTLEAICALPVKDWVEDNAVLYLWVTSPMLRKSFDVVDAWGFDYKRTFVWDKIKHNMGHYNSVRHEFVLIGTRGACQPDKQQLFDSVQSIERDKHSKKPVEFYDIIETNYTHGRKLEVFARSKRDGWDVYGHLAELSVAAE